MPGASCRRSARANLPQRLHAEHYGVLLWASLHVRLSHIVRIRLCHCQRETPPTPWSSRLANRLAKMKGARQRAPCTAQPKEGPTALPARRSSASPASIPSTASPASHPPTHIRENLAWMITSAVFVVLELTAMQVGLAPCHGAAPAGRRLPARVVRLRHPRHPRAPCARSAWSSWQRCSISSRTCRRFSRTRRPGPSRSTGSEPWPKVTGKT